MTRAEIHSSFVTRFAIGRISPSLPDALADVEAELNTLFPQSFLLFATRFGAIHTHDLEDLVTGGESGAEPEGASFDVQEFYSARDILMTTQAYRSAGMEGAYVVFAADSMGNVFGFRTIAGTERPDDATVYVFDHGHGSVSAEAQSFDSWLQSFLNMKK